ncbi:MAG: hypothetical protein BAA04_11395 [Firmicutes bacterium ZCTH02-B6]|nr:MAG: hypothetical protein BAA04_11395 [Firmicutes bacterium ZCTH02-B6]
MESLFRIAACPLRTGGRRQEAPCALSGRGVGVDGQVVLRDVVLPLAAGAVLGLFYFGGLWWTTRFIGRVRQPALLLLGSFAVRMAVILTGFWTVTGGRIKGTATFLAAVLGARQAVLALAQAAHSGTHREAAGPGRAPGARARPEGAQPSEPGPKQQHASLWEVIPQETTSRDVDSQEISPRDLNSREAGPREDAPDEVGPRKADPQEAGPNAS